MPLSDAALPSEPDAHASALADRVAEASRLWTSHIATAQLQMREATEQALDHFARMLPDLDAAIGAGGPGAIDAVDAQTCARRAALRARVEDLMVAFQFQDRVHQILDQVARSLDVGTLRLRDALASGRAPDADEWAALLSAGYATAEQHAVNATGSPAAAPRAPAETTFF